MLRGICFVCQQEKLLTKHHLIGVRDLWEIYPDLPLKIILKVEQNPLSPVILVCRGCHNNLEYLKKIKIKKKETKETKTKLKIRTEKSNEEIIEKFRKKYGAYWSKNKIKKFLTPEESVSS